MKTLFRGILIGLSIGYFVGWFMGQRQHDQQQQAEQDAYQNDPELVALRREIALERQIESALDNLEDEDE